MRRPLLMTLASLALAAPANAQTPVVYRIAVTGTVENGLAPYVARSLREAKAAGAAAAYLDIDTPGGAGRRRRADLGRGAPRALGAAQVEEGGDQPERAERERKQRADDEEAPHGNLCRPLQRTGRLRGVHRQEEPLSRPDEGGQEDDGEGGAHRGR